MRQPPGQALLKLKKVEGHMLIKLKQRLRWNKEQRQQEKLKKQRFLENLLNNRRKKLRQKTNDVII